MTTIFSYKTVTKRKTLLNCKQQTIANLVVPPLITRWRYLYGKASYQVKY